MLEDIKIIFKNTVMKKGGLLLMLFSTTCIIAVAQPKTIQKETPVYSFWMECEAAFKKNDTNAIKKVITLPIRMNLFSSELGDNPNLTLKQFLVEAKNVKRYNFKKEKPILNNDFRKYEAFKGYTFSNNSKYYEVEIRRKASKNTGFVFTIYIEEKKGAFKIFAFGPEIPFNNYGD
jgi:hypothetical protein